MRRNALRPLWIGLLAIAVFMAHGVGQIHRVVHAPGHFDSVAKTVAQTGQNATPASASLITKLVAALCDSPQTCASLDHQLGSHSPVSASFDLALSEPVPSLLVIAPLIRSGTSPASLRARGPPSFITLLS
jgi:hypothetical protein